MAHPLKVWLQRTDLNRQPLGYEPNELPLLYSASSANSKRLSAEFRREQCMKNILLLLVYIIVFCLSTKTQKYENNIKNMKICTLEIAFKGAFLRLVKTTSRCRIFWKLR